MCAVFITKPKIKIIVRSEQKWLKQDKGRDSPFFEIKERGESIRLVRLKSLYRERDEDVECNAFVGTDGVQRSNHLYLTCCADSNKFKTNGLNL